MESIKVSYTYKSHYLIDDIELNVWIKYFNKKN